VGKSSLSALLTATVLLGFHGFLKSTLLKKVLFIDTEQTKNDIRSTRAAIKQISGLSSDELNSRLDYYALRGHTIEERLQMIEVLSNMDSYGLVIIDNVSDLMYSINDDIQTKTVTQAILSFTSKTSAHVVAVLHQNKVNDDARGAIGQELKGKAETVLQLSNTKGIVTVKPRLTRGEAFEPFSFAIAEGKLPVLEAAAPGADLLKHLPDKHLNYSDLVEMICESTGKSERTAARLIKKQVDAGLIRKINGSKYQVNRG
jgi:hypothetical protein